MMKETPSGTPVGVEDPYRYVDRCDHVTDEGDCRLTQRDAEWLGELGGHECPVVEGDWGWRDCGRFRCRYHDRCCRRCGLGEKRVWDENPLLEEHHLMYGEEGHEVTVVLCRWCHARVHEGARIDDDAEPALEALKEKEVRARREREELGFDTARDRRDG